MTHPKKIWHLIEGRWHPKIMEAIDANHAVEVDPENWSFAKPEGTPDMPEPKIVKHSDTPAEVVTEKPADQTEHHEIGFTGEQS